MEKLRDSGIGDLPVTLGAWEPGTFRANPLASDPNVNPGLRSNSLNLTFCLAQSRIAPIALLALPTHYPVRSSSAQACPHQSAQLSQRSTP